LISVVWQATSDVRILVTSPGQRCDVIGRIIVRTLFLPGLPPLLRKSSTRLLRAVLQRVRLLLVGELVILLTFGGLRLSLQGRFASIFGAFSHGLLGGWSLGGWRVGDSVYEASVRIVPKESKQRRELTRCTGHF
jgi:hypothetical protein